MIRISHQKAIEKGLITAKAKQPKYRNRRIEVGGQKFDSGGEYRRYLQLQFMAKSGVIADLQRQVAFELAPAVKIAGRMRPPLRYIADFVYLDTRSNTVVVEDFKGADKVTEGYRIKRHLMATVHGISIREIRAK